MQVAYVHGPHDLRLDDVQTPQPGPDDVVVRVGAVGVCGSDLGYLAMGGVGMPAGQPFPLGHEFSGVIETVGDAVRGWSAGEKVVVNPLYNLIGNGGPEGGFADRILIRGVASEPGSLLRIPDSMSLDTGALVEPLAVALHGINRSGAVPGSKVAIFGAGPIGLCAVAGLTYRGIKDVVVFDLSAYRRERAMAMGALAAIDPTVEAPADALKRLHGTADLRGWPMVATNVFIDAAGASGIIEGCVAMAPFGAQITVIAVAKAPASLDLGSLLGKELSVNAAMAYREEFGDAIAMLTGGLDLSPIVSHSFDGPDLLAAFATASKQDSAAKVLVRYSADAL